MIHVSIATATRHENAVRDATRCLLEYVVLDYNFWHVIAVSQMRSNLDAASMPAQNKPRRHHYIPEFYLKRWALGGHHLTEFSRPRPGSSVVKPKRVTPKQTGFVDRLYEMRGLPADQAQIVEELFFAPVDNNAAHAMYLMLSGETVASASVRSAWVRFMLSLMVRNPEEIALMKKMWADYWRKPTTKQRSEYLKFRQAGDPNTLDDFLADTPDDQLDRAALSAFVKALSSLEAGIHIMNMNWGILRVSPLAPAIMTSDRPMIRQIGLAEPEGYILLPLGPKEVFYAVNRRETARYLALIPSEQLVSDVNLTIAKQAHKYVYATTDAVLPFVQRWMSDAPAPLVSADFSGSKSTDGEIARLRRRARRAIVR